MRNTKKGAIIEVMYTHDGHEFGIVLEDKLQIELNEERYILNKCESIVIPSSQSCSIANFFEGTATTM